MALHVKNKQWKAGGGGERRSYGRKTILRGALDAFLSRNTIPHHTYKRCCQNDRTSSAHHTRLLRGGGGQMEAGLTGRLPSR